jgi:hypothetical protein
MEEGGVSVVPNRMRPLSVGDIVDEAIRLYRGHFRLFLTIGAVIVIPIAVIEVLLLIISQSSDDLLVTFLANTLSAIAGGLVYLVLAATLMIVASESWFGRALTAQEAFDRAWERFGPLIGLVIVFGLAIAGMSITVVGIPFAVFFAVAWSLALPLVVVERAGIRRALGRSRDLVRGYWWRVLGIAVLISIITSIISTFFAIPAMIFGASTFWMDPTGDLPLSAAVLSTIGGAAGRIVTAPITFCSWVLLYYDQRIRKEGLDIELALHEMEREQEAATAQVRAGPSF